MKLLFIRGAVPRDRDWREIAFTSIEDSDDIYEHISYRLGNEASEICYWGMGRKIDYSDKCLVRWRDDYKKYRCRFEPDVVINRGGFKEGAYITKQYPKAFKVYLGCGIRYRPDDGINYDLILVDSERQQRKCNTDKAKLWIKPAPEFFKPPETYNHEFDVCYIANGTQDIKGHKFVRDTCPRDMKVLHLGFPSCVDKLPNVTHKRVQRRDMPEWIGKCKVGIIPYEKNDSCPRAMVEMLACGLPVVALDTVQFWEEKYRGVSVRNKDCFWHAVREEVADSPTWNRTISNYYKENLSMDKSVEYLKGLINDLQ